MNFYILTLFPEMVMQPLMTSITGRAVKQNKIGIEAINIRDYTKDKHKKVDDYPYGGGAGMLMQAQPVYDACMSVLNRLPEGKKRVIYVSPQGTPFTQQMAQEFSEQDELLLLCGHYEGIDERVLEEVVTDVVSIGDYVLTGGELAAMVIVDAVARLLPDVLNNGQSAQTESFHGCLLEYPQYSRPEIWHGKKVPSVLLSGNQKNIAAWQKESAIQRTKERRPDLYMEYEKLEECMQILMQQKLNHMDMIELIRRGRAKLLWRMEKEMILADKESAVYYHTNLNPDYQESAYDWGKMMAAYTGLVLHQNDMAEKIQAQYGLHFKQYSQFVFTRREKLPVSGLYSLCEKEKADKRYFIRPLNEKDAALLKESLPSDEFSNIEDRVKKRSLLGCFSDGHFAGCMGICADGSIGHLFVLPGYRRKRVAQALESCLINSQLEQGLTPFTQTEETNVPFFALQEKLGLYKAQNIIFRLFQT